MSTRSRRWVAHVAFVTTGMLLLASVGSLLAGPSHAAGAPAGSAGADTALPPTPSAVTVPGRGRFASLQVTVNQTTDLVNQAVSVTWTGADPASSVASQFLQIFQCWGEDDGSNAINPGPAPEHCQFGAQPFTGNLERKLPADVAVANEFTRAITQSGWPDFDPTIGDYDSSTGKVWKPFVAVDGTVVSRQLALVSSTSSGVTTAWQNPFFSFNTTNEIDFGRSYLDGRGSELFEVQTGLEAPGLGCGQKVEHRADGSVVAPRCWLVVVPRGTAAEENPPGLDPTRVVSSPLAPAAWANRIAVPLQFNPVDSACAIGSDERRIVGNEIATAAVTSWQPALCGTPGAAPYAFAAISDDQARSQLTQSAGGGAGLAIVSHPLAPTARDTTDPPVYAPVALSGLVIGFNVERVPTDANGQVPDPAEVPLAGTRVAQLNLTPRLVAKLLTQSYQSQFFNLRASIPPGYDWVLQNPYNLMLDPDFVRFNPEFAKVFVGNSRTASGLVLEASTSDAAQDLWRWVLGDPEAATWLAGTADPWGMNVNPHYSTNPARNPAGAAFGDPAPDSFVRNDPYCYQDASTVGNPPQPVRPLCMLDTQPPSLSYQTSAQATRAANDGAKTELDNFAQSGSTAWVSEGPQRAGSRSILTVTDSASAARYGLQVASLSRAGDDGNERPFVAPTAASFVAGVAAMSVTPAGTLAPDPTAATEGGYPLTALAYAVARPHSLADAARVDYARFVEYAAGDGQTPGLSFGQLPPGYAPLPDALRVEARNAVEAIRSPAPIAEPGAGSDPGGATGASGAGTGTVRAGTGTGARPAAAPASAAPLTPGPAAVGSAKTVGASTPADRTGLVRFVLPTLLGAGMLSSLGFLYLAEPRRKARPGPRTGRVQPKRPST